MSKDDGVAQVVREETGRQTVILVFSVAGTLAMLYVMRKFSEPDLYRETKMRIALKVKRFAQKRVDYWQGVADKAATVYQQERL